MMHSYHLKLDPLRMNQGMIPRRREDGGIDEGRWWSLIQLRTDGAEKDRHQGGRDQKQLNCLTGRPDTRGEALQQEKESVWGNK